MNGFISATSLSFVFRMVTESGTVLGGRPDFLHHTAGAVFGRYGGICRGNFNEIPRLALKSYFIPVPYKAVYRFEQK